MKSTTMAIALVLLYVLIIPPNSYGARGPTVRPGSIMRPQQAVLVHPGPLRPQRALPQGHFRQPGPEQAGRMGAARPRYARDNGASDAAFTVVGQTVANVRGVVEPYVTRQTDATQKLVHASSNTAEATVADVAAGTRRRRYQVNL